MEVYSRSFMSTGVIQNDGFHDLRDQSLISDWCHLPLRKSFSHRWVRYSKHQMTRGFVRNHSLKRFFVNGSIIVNNLPVGVCSTHVDNSIFWKNVGRSELLLMNIAQHRLDELKKSSTTSVSTRLNTQYSLNNQLYLHRENFRLTQHFSRINKGMLVNLKGHMIWRQFLEALPDNQVDPTRSVNYLKKAISRFSWRCGHQLSYLIDKERELSYQSLVEYIRLVVIEFVIPEMLNGNSYPAVQFFICFPDSSKSIYLRSPEFHRIAI